MLIHVDERLFRNGTQRLEAYISDFSGRKILAFWKENPGLESRDFFLLMDGLNSEV